MTPKLQNLMVSELRCQSFSFVDRLASQIRDGLRSSCRYLQFDCNKESDKTEAYLPFIFHSCLTWHECRLSEWTGGMGRRASKLQCTGVINYDTGVEQLVWLKSLPVLAVVEMRTINRIYRVGRFFVSIHGTLYICLPIRFIFECHL